MFLRPFLERIDSVAELRVVDHREQVSYRNPEGFGDEGQRFPV
jgi:hypothetical protein